MRSKRVCKNSVICVKRPKEQVIDFENHVVLNYLDIKPYHDEMNKAFIQFMSEEVING